MNLLNICRPKCVHNNNGTVLSIKSNCFSKPIKIYISDDDDETLEKVQELIREIERKKTLIKSQKNSDMNIKNILI